MKYGLCSIARRYDDLAEVCAEAAELGFDGLELWAQPPHLPALTAAAGAAAAAVVRAAGLETAVFGSYLRPGAEDFAAQLDGTLAAARGYGAPRMRVWAGGLSDSEASREDWDACLHDFRRLLAVCGDLELTVERHGRTLTESAAGTQRLLDALTDPRVTLNFQYAAGLDTTATCDEVRRFGPRIGNCHAQNHLGGQPSALEHGELDYRRIIQALIAAGFDGWIEVEFARYELRSSELTPEQRRAGLQADLRCLQEAVTHATEER
ncbi:MAG: sugar phosphate isomerase/epimerase [Fimbriimonadaceae bacterium]|nr:sugar phosphate isomerase/epimerase [Fimbriimonadaceae bacterium]